MRVSAGTVWVVRERHNLIPLIDKPTRVTSTSSTLIDHIWTNITLPTQSCVINSDLTDHFPIAAFFPINPINKNIELSFRDYSTSNVNAFKQEFPLLADDFRCDTLDADNFISAFNDFVMTKVNHFFPISKKTIDLRKLVMPWIV